MRSETLRFKYEYRLHAVLMAGVAGCHFRWRAGCSEAKTSRQVAREPAAALAELDLDRLQLETGSFIDADLREKFSDLLLSVRLADSIAETTSENAEARALVYFLFEHKSQADPLTVFQLLSYIVRIWEKRLRDGLPLCPIVPLVVYHGETGWTAARSISKLVPSPKGLADYQLNFQIPLLDLSQLSDEDIAGGPF